MEGVGDVISPDFCLTIPCLRFYLAPSALVLSVWRSHTDHLKEGALLLVLGCLLPGALMTFHNGKLQPTKSLNLTFKTYVVRAHVLLPVRTLA